MKSIFYLILMILGLNSLNGQSVIQLNDPSFEGLGDQDQFTKGWLGCENSYETGPEVYKVPKEGESYMLLITRDNQTWESICQELESPLQVEQTYAFDIYLARSEECYSVSTETNLEVSYNKAVTLRVWGGSKECDKQELLAETDTIGHSDWKKYKLEFSPKSSIDYLILEAFYKKPSLLPYNGNLLLDACSDIRNMKYFQEIDTSKNVGEIEESILNCDLDGIPDDELVSVAKISMLKALYDFEYDINDAGILPYIVSEPFSDLTRLIRNLERLNFNNSVAVVKRITKLTLDPKELENQTEEEVNFLESCEHLFKDKFEEDDFTAKIHEYIQRNKVSILGELRWCR